MLNKALTFLTMLLLIACDKPDNNATDTVLDGSVVAVQEPYQFGVAIYDQVSTKEGMQNIVISPWSIQTALSMTANAADGQTYQEILDVLQYNLASKDAINQDHVTKADLISMSNTDEAFVNVANACFWEPGCMTLDSKLEQSLQESYSCYFDPNNFTKEAINQWVSDHTDEKIDQVIDEIKSDEVLFLINALYAMADWENGFDEVMTVDGAFTTPDGPVSVPMMQSDAIRSYYQDEAMTVLEMPFKGGAYSMTFFLHDFEAGSIFNQITDIEALVDVYDNKLEENRLLLTMPKFKLKYKISLQDQLTDMGMESPWAGGSADLPGFISNCGAPYLSRVIHETFLKVDERGIEGAAVTVVGVGVESVPPVINLNRPFEFLIRHTETHIPIFMGRVMDPRG